MSSRWSTHHRTKVLARRAHLCCNSATNPHEWTVNLITKGINWMHYALSFRTSKVSVHPFLLILLSTSILLVKLLDSSCLFCSILKKFAFDIEAFCVSPFYWYPNCWLPWDESKVSLRLRMGCTVPPLAMGLAAFFTTPMWPSLLIRDVFPLNRS